MRTQSIDTSPAFERIQIERMRTSSGAKKFASVRSWTQSITSANLHSAYGSSDKRQERDRAMAFVACEYGDRLAYLFSQAIAKQPEWRLQPPDLQEALLPLIEAAEHLNVAMLLTGSVTSSIYGFPRSAHDVDLLADFHSEHLIILRECLADSYVFASSPSSLSGQHDTSFSVLDVSRLIKIDVILPSTTFEKSLLERRQAQTLIEGRAPLFMVSAEDMTLLNLRQYQATQADDRWNDILGVLKVQALTLDLAYLDQQAKSMGVEELLSQALIDAGIREEEPSSSSYGGASLLQRTLPEKR